MPLTRVFVGNSLTVRLTCFEKPWCVVLARRPLRVRTCAGDGFALFSSPYVSTSLWCVWQASKRLIPLADRVLIKRIVPELKVGSLRGDANHGHAACAVVARLPRCCYDDQCSITPLDCVVTCWCGAVVCACHCTDGGWHHPSGHVSQEERGCGTFAVGCDSCRECHLHPLPLLCIAWSWMCC